MCKHTRMLMATKTLTIMEDVYKLLLENKIENESFSEELRRLLSRKRGRKLSEFFGLISDEEGESMVNELKKIRSLNKGIKVESY